MNSRLTHSWPGPKGHLAFGEVSCLLHADHVVFLPLVLVHVLLLVAVAQLDPGPVGKQEAALGLVVLHRPGKLRHQGPHVVLLKLRQGPAKEQLLEARVPEGQQHQLPAHGPALAPAPGPAVGGVGGRGEKEGLLLGIGLALQTQGLHRLYASASPSRITCSGSMASSAGPSVSPSSFRAAWATVALSSPKRAFSWM